jgi:hypothetical protein
MYLYRGRTLRISDEFVEEFADTLGVKLSQNEADCFVEDVLKIDPETPEFANVPDSEVLRAIVDGAQQDMNTMRGL